MGGASLALVADDLEIASWHRRDHKRLTLERVLYDELISHYAEVTA
jgi:hypothetical protein